MSSVEGPQQIRLRRLVSLNPPVPHSIKVRPQDVFRLLPMEEIHEFSAPGEGFERPAADLLGGYSYLESTDVAYAKVTPCFENGKGVIGTRDLGPVFATTELTVLRPGDKIDQRFLAYILQSELFRQPAIRSMTGAGGLKRVSERAILNLKIPVPSLHVQRAIADFLDHETAEVDQFVADSELLKEYLGERAEARLSELLWGASGATIPLRRAIESVDQGRSPDVHAEAAESGGRGVLKAGCTNFGIFDPEANKRLDDNFTIHAHELIHNGDLLVTRASGSLRHVGSAAMVRDVDRTLMLSDKIYKVNVNADFDAEFICQVMQTRRFRVELEACISGAEGLARNISLSSLKGLSIPWLPVVAQRNISDLARRATKSVHGGICDIDRAIALAKERRAALISAAVTGQIDVTARRTPAAEQLEDDIAQGVHTSS